MPERIDTVVIGGGQAGLCASHELQRTGREHVVLERGRVGERWRRASWDSFHLVTPSWTVRLPGVTPPGDPDGFLHRDQLIGLLERFARRVDPPLREGVEVERVTAGHGTPFRVETSGGTIEADRVIVAAGTFQRAKLPDAAHQLPAGPAQVHARDYHRPDDLPDGPVLVVGSGQSGTQIADELRRAGRPVALSVSRAGRIPRRYRGRDAFAWADLLGMFDRTVDQLDDPDERFAPNPAVSGRDGGREMNLHAFARDGIRLLGRFRGADRGRAVFADDLHERLRAVDQGVAELKAGVDRLIEARGLDAPAASDEPPLDHGFRQDPPTELELDADGIAAVVWATGYTWSFDWIDAPVRDRFGYPVQRRGISEIPGLAFVGLHWMHTLGSGLLFGVAADAEHVVNALEAQARA
ncbi:MAG: NAD(P)-binding domain-containing protein [Deinococcus-Thermus bacterium]|jgi:putative flavoprotein involved in K+ transport|nr:NAD(P)-binding domain-containing protein [Deinococcota bacterium]